MQNMLEKSFKRKVSNSHCTSCKCQYICNMIWPYSTRRGRVARDQGAQRAQLNLIRGLLLQSDELWSLVDLKISASLAGKMGRFSLRDYRLVLLTYCKLDRFV